MSLIILTFIGLYLVISILVVVFVVKKVDKKGIHKWKYGLPAGLFMYMIVFWDHIPTIITHRIYCNSDGGIFIYKTVDEWISENPGVADTQTFSNSISAYDRDGYRYTRKLSERFNSEMIIEPVFLSVRRVTKKFLDRENGTALVKSIDYMAGGKFGDGSLIGSKFWLKINNCPAGRPKDIPAIYANEFRVLGVVER